MGRGFAICVLAAVSAGLLTACGSGDDAAPGPAVTAKSQNGTLPPTATRAPAQSPTNTPSKTPSQGSRNVAALPAAAIVARAKAALAMTNTLRITGTFMDGGTTTVVDLSFAKAGAHGTVTTDGAPARVVRIGDITYLQLTDAAWRKHLPKRQADAVIEMLRGRWVKASVTDPDYAAFTDLTDLDSTVDDVLAESARRFTKTAIKLVDGVRCVGLDDGQGVLWVDVRTARPVRLETRALADSGGLDLTQYNTAKEAAAPPEDLVVDSSRISG
jgi:hypothetical protein